MWLLSIAWTGEHEHGPLARIGRSVFVVRIMVEVPVVRQCVVVVKRIAILLIVLKIEPHVITSVELVPFQNVTVKSEISTTIN